MSKTNLMVKVAFPEVTEIRIGSALRLALGYYVKLNKMTYDEISKDKLMELLFDLPSAYKYKTIMNYSNYVLDTLIGISSSSKKMEFEGIEEVNEKSAEYGLNLIPIEMLEYFNTSLIQNLVLIALYNLNEEIPKMYSVTVKKEVYEKFFESKDNNEDSFKTAVKFVEGLKNWLEYNMIVRVNSFYIEPGTMNVIFPVRFSFLQKLKEK